MNARMRSLTQLFALLLVLALAANAFAAPVTQAIKTDHFGYRPGDVKIAIFSANPGATVQVRDAGDVVRFTVPTDAGSIVSKGSDVPSGDSVWWVDFSALATPGTYRLYSPALAAQSYDFELADDAYNEAMKSALATFYLQRCGTPKLSAYAGDWADNASCHATDSATTAASGHTNYGTLSLGGGWHDAGDYNKYVWGAASTAVRSLLLAYERSPALFPDGTGTVPESGNGRSDLLDEVKWELDWMAKMQLGSGAVLYQMHVDGFASSSPPSADTNRRYYQNPNMESAAVLAGSFAHAARVFSSVGESAYAATLQTRALSAWTWLQSQSDSAADAVREIKVWAAAELYKSFGTTSAKSYVDAFYPSSWAGRFYNVARYDTFAALAYVTTPGANATVSANMRASIRDQVNYLFSNDDLYRNGMPSWSYHWGSNTPRASQGLFLLAAADLGETGSQSAAACRQHALDTLHFFHGQNALNMLYLSNMAALGGEHSSFQFYHAWYGDSNNSFSRSNFLGKTTAIVEPDYPYFKGTDNLGVNDNKLSTFGPAPGFVPGGPNASYSGTAIPPKNAAASNRFYRDWADQTDWTAVTWEITENSIGYQGPYVALAAAFADPTAGGCSSSPECDDGLYCNGAEACVASACQAGTAPCTGGATCDEASDSCLVDPCDHDGVCEPGEECDNCSTDCVAGGVAACGNGVCEPTAGEDCLSCAADCAGKQGGNPSSRYCCGDGAGSNPVGCADARCTANGFACSASAPIPFCCGDLACTGAESSCSCGLDCGAPTAEMGNCANGEDDDCDGLVDCLDAQCAADPACAPPCDGDGLCEPGEDCHGCSSDCPGRTSGKPSLQYCCGDGIRQKPEGNGSICDGNV